MYAMCRERERERERQRETDRQTEASCFSDVESSLCIVRIQWLKTVTQVETL